MVLEAHRQFGQRGLEYEHVPAAAELGVVEEAESEGGRRWDGQRHRPRPALRCVGDGRVRDQASPVVTDEYGVGSTPEHFVQGADIERQGACVVAPVVGHLGGRVTPQKRSDGVVAGVGQAGEEVPPGMGRVREPMQAQGQRAIDRARLETGEIEPVGDVGPGSCAGLRSSVHCRKLAWLILCRGG